MAVEALLRSREIHKLYRHDTILDFHDGIDACDAAVVLRRAGVTVAVSGGGYVIPARSKKVGGGAGGNWIAGGGCDCTRAVEHRHVGEWDIVRTSWGARCCRWWVEPARRGWVMRSGFTGSARA